MCVLGLHRLITPITIVVCRLLGIACLRVDIEQGKPSFVMIFAATVEDARLRALRHYENSGQADAMGLD